MACTYHRRPRVAALALAVWLGCVGVVDDPSPAGGAAAPAGGAPRGAGGASGNVPGTAGAPGATTPGMMPGPGVFVAAAPAMQRLSEVQFKNAVRDLLGTGADVTTDLLDATTLKGFRSIGAAEFSVARKDAENYEAAAYEVLLPLFADEAQRMALVGCAPSSVADPCVRAFIDRFGRRAWRRPLAKEEGDQLFALAAKLGPLVEDTWTSVAYTVAAMLQSPHFVFRVDRGEPDPTQPGRRRYTAFEMASRLSFLLWGTTPDSAGLDAATRGDVLTVDGVRAEATRLLASRRARAAIVTFFSEHTRLDLIDEVQKDTRIFPAWTLTMPQSAKREVSRLFEDIVFDQQADIREILDTRATYANNELARLYGLPVIMSATHQKVMLDEMGPRGGMMTTAAMMAINAGITGTSPTKRGKFIRTHLLCQEVPAPPPGANTILAEPKPGVRQTMRQRVDEHRTNVECAGCHALMDPLGLAFENFDGVGVQRTTEAGMPIDASGELDGTKFAGPRELLALIKARPGLGACFVRQAFRFGTAHQETPGEQLVLDALAKKFTASGHKLTQLMLDLVTSDAFRFAGEPN